MATSYPSRSGNHSANAIWKQLFLDSEPETKIRCHPVRDLPFTAWMSNATMPLIDGENFNCSWVPRRRWGLLSIAQKRCQGWQHLSETITIYFSRFVRSLFSLLRFFIAYLTLPFFGYFHIAAFSHLTDRQVSSRILLTHFVICDLHPDLTISEPLFPLYYYLVSIYIVPFVLFNVELYKQYVSDYKKQDFSIAPIALSAAFQLTQSLIWISPILSTSQMQLVAFSRLIDYWKSTPYEHLFS